MRRRMRQDLVTAMKARDRVAVAALRTTLAAIDNAEAVDVGPGAPATTTNSHIAGASAGVGSADVPRRELSDADLSTIVRAQVDERRQAAEEYDRLGRADEADTLRREAAVLSAYLAA